MRSVGMMANESDPCAPWRRHLTPGEKRKVATLDAEIAAAQAHLSKMRAQRKRLMRAANTRRYIERKRHGRH
jgi:hypothetical protein